MRLRYLILLLIIFPLVKAQVTSQVITQNQLDNLDIENINFDCRYENYNINYVRGQPFEFSFNLSCLNIYNLGNDGNIGNYEIIRENYQVLYFVHEYMECLSDGLTTQNCIDGQVIPRIIQQTRDEIKARKERIEQMQTQNIMDLPLISINPLLLNVNSVNN